MELRNETNFGFSNTVPKNLKDPKEAFPFFYNPTLSLTSVILLKEVPPTSDLQCLDLESAYFFAQYFCS